MVEEWDVKYAAIALHELLEAYPLLSFDVLIYYVNLLVTLGKADLFLELPDVPEDVHLFRVKMVQLVLKLRSHQISVDLKLQLQMLFVSLAIR